MDGRGWATATPASQRDPTPRSGGASRIQRYPTTKTRQSQDPSTACSNHGRRDHRVSPPASNRHSEVLPKARRRSRDLKSRERCEEEELTGEKLGWRTRRRRAPPPPQAGRRPPAAVAGGETWRRSARFCWVGGRPVSGESDPRVEQFFGVGGTGLVSVTSVHCVNQASKLLSRTR